MPSRRPPNNPMADLLKPSLTEAQIENKTKQAATEAEHDELRRMCQDLSFAMDLDKITKKSVDTGRSTGYPPEKKLAAALGYILHNNISKVSRMVGVPAHTIAGWKNRSEWWPEIVDRARGYFREKNYGQLIEIMDKANQRAITALSTGDEKVLSDGTIVKVAVTGKDAALIGKLAQEQVLYMREEAALKNGKVEEELREIKDALRGLGRAKKAELIEGEVEDVTDED